MGRLIAGRVAEEVARLREQAAREAEACSLHSAREQQERLAADRAMARAALGRWSVTAGGSGPVMRTSRRRGRPRGRGRRWSPGARRAADTIRDQVSDRYGIDADDLGSRGLGLGAGPAPVLQRVLAEHEHALEAGSEGSARRARADQERAVAVLLASESAEDRAEGDGLAVAAQAGDVRKAAARYTTATGGVRNLPSTWVGRCPRSTLRRSRPVSWPTRPTPPQSVPSRACRAPATSRGHAAGPQGCVTPHARSSDECGPVTRPPSGWPPCRRRAAVGAWWVGGSGRWRQTAVDTVSAMMTSWLR